MHTDVVSVTADAIPHVCCHQSTSLASFMAHHKYNMTTFMHMHHQQDGFRVHHKILRPALLTKTFPVIILSMRINIYLTHDVKTLRTQLEVSTIVPEKSLQNNSVIMYNTLQIINIYKNHTLLLRTMKKQLTERNLDAINRILTPELILIKPAVPFVKTDVTEIAAYFTSG